MNHKDFISQLSERTKYSHKLTDVLVTSLVTSIVKELEESHQVSLSGLGRFRVEKENERVVEHPSEGTRLLIPPTLTIHFESDLMGENKTELKNLVTPTEL